MDTVKNFKSSGIAFINDKSVIIDHICDNFLDAGGTVTFCSKNIQDGLTQLSTVQETPEVCIIDLDFYEEDVLAQLQELKTSYPELKLIAHSDIDTEKTITSLLAIGIDGYLLLGSDPEDFRNAITSVLNNKKYFSAGVAKIAQEYFK